MLCDTHMDISKMGRACDIVSPLKRSSRGGGDTSGYRYPSGREDGSTAEPSGNWDNHQDDCALWFDAYQNDSNGYGMPYGWEKEYGLDPTVNDGSSDGDNDGATNYQEWKIGNLLF